MNEDGLTRFILDVKEVSQKICDDLDAFIRFEDVGSEFLNDCVI